MDLNEYVFLFTGELFHPEFFFSLSVYSAIRQSSWKCHCYVSKAIRVFPRMNGKTWLFRHFLYRWIFYFIWKNHFFSLLFSILSIFLSHGGMHVIVFFYLFFYRFSFHFVWRERPLDKLNPFLLWLSVLPLNLPSLSLSCYLQSFYRPTVAVAYFFWFHLMYLYWSFTFTIFYCYFIVLLYHDQAKMILAQLWPQPAVPHRLLVPPPNFSSHTLFQEEETK